ncbi:hypothetical protein GJ744_009089 [Endocarpon pusillum]|uniref:Aminodeoxychorismate lyase n=1 Tax=Endocarpon pusillum TaxID=364733 RepID=A0A8H7E4R6_9EURO|nr:hypothetical protein GJ744_009089 [Endocarpon pusillum]
MEKAEDAVLRVSSSTSFYIFTSYLWRNHVECTNHCGEHYFLPYHRDRLVSAAEAFGWTGVTTCIGGDVGMKRLSGIVVDHLKTVCEEEPVCAMRKIKICIYKDNRFHIETTAITPTDSPNVFHLPTNLNEVATLNCHCLVKLDLEPTPASLFTSYKTSERIPYDRARGAADIAHKSPTAAEVLLFNPHGEITECSVSTPYFQRHGRWVTPSLSSGGNAGVTRRLALENGLCEEQTILMESLRHQEIIWISNGVRGFIPATLLLEPLS